MGPRWNPARRARWIGAGLVLLLVTVALSPPVRSRAKAVLLTVEAFPSPLRPLTLITPSPSREPAGLTTTDADVYRPRGFSTPPGLLVLHGANPRGKDDDRVVQLAATIARAGRTVLVPNLELRHRRIDPEDRERIRESIRHLAPGGEVAVLAFSYGAALALVALAEDGALQDHVVAVATVGTYADLEHLIQGVTTGTVPYRGRLVPWETVPEARDLMVEQVAALLEPGDGRALVDAWEHRDPSGLGAGPRAVYELMANRDPARVGPLVRRLPSELADVLHQLSPLRHTGRLRVPIFALHDRDDPAAPVSESRLLIEALRARDVTARFWEVEVFDHVEPLGSPLEALRDARRVAAFTAALLRAQEGWPRP